MDLRPPVERGAFIVCGSAIASRPATDGCTDSGPRRGLRSDLVDALDGEVSLQFSAAGDGRYLVLVDGAVVGAVEKRVGLARGYPGSKQIREARNATWHAVVRDVEGLSLADDERYAIERAIKGRKTTRGHGVADLLHAYEAAGVELPVVER